jgi:hypothetical protein
MKLGQRAMIAAKVQVILNITDGASATGANVSRQILSNVPHTHTQLPALLAEHLLL